MVTNNDRRWLVNALLVAVAFVMASFLPWLNISGSVNETGNAFTTNATFFGISIPNWCVMALTVIIATFAALQYKGVVQRSNAVPLVLSIAACAQCAIAFVAVIVGHPDTPKFTINGPSDEFNGAIQQAFAQQFNQTRIEIHPGLGLVLAVILTIWLVIAAFVNRAGNETNIESRLEAESTHS